jgi:hypothetical protein
MNRLSSHELAHVLSYAVEPSQCYLQFLGFTHSLENHEPQSDVIYNEIFGFHVLKRDALSKYVLANNVFPCEMQTQPENALLHALHDAMLRIQTTEPPPDKIIFNTGDWKFVWLSNELKVKCSRNREHKEFSFNTTSGTVVSTENMVPSGASLIVNQLSRDLPLMGRCTVFWPDRNKLVTMQILVACMHYNNADKLSKVSQAFEKGLAHVGKEKHAARKYEEVLTEVERHQQNTRQALRDARENVETGIQSLRQQINLLNYANMMFATAALNRRVVQLWIRVEDHVNTATTNISEAKSISESDKEKAVTLLEEADIILQDADRLTLQATDNLLRLQTEYAEWRHAREQRPTTPRRTPFLKKHGVALALGGMLAASGLLALTVNDSMAFARSSQEWKKSAAEWGSRAKYYEHISHS